MTGGGDVAEQMVLNAFLMNTGHHEASWRLPESDPFIATDVRHYQALARSAELGKLDSIFFADWPGLPSGVERRPPQLLEPTLLLAAIAAVTDRIGLIATATTTFDEPFNTARRFASLDLISNGRAGWNAVTTADPTAGLNFGLTENPAHAERYDRAREYLEVVLGLWGGWDDDATVGDKVSGVHTDASKVRTLDHEGERFRVKGPLNVGRSPQGHPVIVQAGSSGPGIALAAAYAEAVFTATPTVEEARTFYTTLKAAVREAGRDPRHVKVLPGIVPVIGSTEAEAAATQRALDELMVIDHPLRQLSDDIGIPVDQIDLDGPLPSNIRPVEEIQGSPSRYQLTIDLARRDNLTVREILWRLAGGRGHRTRVGTPEQIADDLELWFRTGAADGFNVMAPVLPSGLETFVETVVPLLQRRGLFRREYAGSTLREHYGLPTSTHHPLTGSAGSRRADAR